MIKVAMKLNFLFPVLLFFVVCYFHFSIMFYQNFRYAFLCMFECGQYLGMQSCEGCGHIIKDPYVLLVQPDLAWHTSCLKCTVCNAFLSESETNTCFIKDGKPYCKTDYQEKFAIRCEGCDFLLNSHDFVMKADEKLYHTRCFACHLCQRILKPGDLFRLMERKVVCNQHNTCSKEIKVEGEMKIRTSGTPATMPVTTTTTTAKHDIGEKKICKGNFKSTRIRTVLTEKQLATLKACYARNPRPDAVMKEHLVQLTGLSPRVIRVWFQNKRCKDKKKSVVLANQIKVSGINCSYLETNCLTHFADKTIYFDTIPINQWMGRSTFSNKFNATNALESTQRADGNDQQYNVTSWNSVFDFSLCKGK